MRWYGPCAMEGAALQTSAEISSTDWQAVLPRKWDMIAPSGADRAGSSLWWQASCKLKALSAEWVRPTPLLRVVWRAAGALRQCSADQLRCAARWCHPIYP